MMKKKVRSLDERVSRIVAHWPAALHSFFAQVTIAGTPGITFAISGLLMCAGLLLRSTELFYFGMAAAATLAIGIVMKHSFRRRRPDTEYVTDMKLKSYSFPSGHSVGGAMIYGGFAWLAASLIVAPFGQVVATLLVLFAGVIGVSRVYLGAHYASDVIAGWTLGALGVLIYAISIPLA